jgi:hypothetical protein
MIFDRKLAGNSFEFVDSAEREGPIFNPFARVQLGTYIRFATLGLGRTVPPGKSGAWIWQTRTNRGKECADVLVSTVRNR